MKSFKNLILIGGIFVATLPTANSSDNESPSELAKVGGSYQVESVKRISDHHFRVKFSSTVKTGRLDTLWLDTDHMHVALSDGQEIRLSAEILVDNGKTAEISQVVLFLPGRGGPVPIWLLSKKNDGRELRGAKYLEMHAPLNDFLIF